MAVVLNSVDTFADVACREYPLGQAGVSLEVSPPSTGTPAWGTPVSGSDHYEETWVWNCKDMSPGVTLSSDRTAAYFHIDPVLESTGSASVRSTKGFREGEHTWSISFLEPPHGTSVMVGVATKKANLYTTNHNFNNLIGADDQSWGLSYKGTVWHNGTGRHYCDPFYDTATVISVSLNLYTGTLVFLKNGRSLGVAFTGLNEVDGDLYPIISSTGTNTEMEVGLRTSRYLTLQEKCFLTVARHLCHREDVNQLPLPARLKGILSAIK